MRAAGRPFDKHAGEGRNRTGMFRDWRVTMRLCLISGCSGWSLKLIKRIQPHTKKRDKVGANDMNPPLHQRQPPAIQWWQQHPEGSKGIYSSNPMHPILLPLQDLRHFVSLPVGVASVRSCGCTSKVLTQECIHLCRTGTLETIQPVRVHTLSYIPNISGISMLLRMGGDS